MSFFTILLYNSALLSGQPKLLPGKYAIRLMCPADDSEKKKEYGSLFSLEAFEFCGSSLPDEHNTLPKSTRRNVKLNKFAFGTQ